MMIVSTHRRCQEETAKPWFKSDKNGKTRNVFYMIL